MLLDATFQFDAISIMSFAMCWSECLLGASIPVPVVPNLFATADRSTLDNFTADRGVIYDDRLEKHAWSSTAPLRL